MYFQGALRLALALATARLLAGVLDLSHGFWVLLTVLTLLRASAAETRSLLWPALVGTLVGSVLAGALLMAEIPPTAYAVVLPLVMLVGFAAGPLLGLGWGQALFTLVIALVFALIALGFAAMFVQSVLRNGRGTPKMQEIAGAVQEGASAYLIKTIGHHELVSAIRASTEGETDMVTLSVSRGGLAGLAASGASVLSARELEVLTLVARAASNAEIARHLVLAEATVKTHVSAVLRKLGARDRVQAVVVAYETGFVTRS